MTKQFTMTIGINEGYFHQNELKNGVAIVSELWQKLAEKYYKTTNIYISAVINSSKTIYRPEWGCPKSGENTVTITSVLNKDFVTDIQKWKDCIEAIALDLKKQLKQSTVLLQFSDIDTIYLTD